MSAIHRFVISLSALVAAIAIHASPAFSVGEAFCVKCIFDCPESQQERGVICEALCLGDFGAAVCSSGQGCDPEEGPTTIVCEMHPE